MLKARAEVLGSWINILATCFEIGFADEFGVVGVNEGLNVLSVAQERSPLLLVQGSREAAAKAVGRNSALLSYG